MKALPPNRRAAALIASLGAIVASSSALLATRGHSQVGPDFLVGLLVGVAAGVAVLLLVKWRGGSSGASPR